MILHNISKHLLVFSLAVVFQAWTTVAECIPEAGISRCVNVEMHFEVEYLTRGITKTSEYRRSRTRSRGYKEYMDEQGSSLSEAIQREKSISNYNRRMSDISSAHANSEAQSNSASISVSGYGVTADASFSHATDSSEERSNAEAQEAVTEASNAMKFATELNKQLNRKNTWATDEEVEEEYESSSEIEYQGGRFQVWRKVESDLIIDGQSISEVETQYVLDFETAPTSTELFDLAKDYLKLFILEDANMTLDLSVYTVSAMMLVPLQNYEHPDVLSELRQSIIQQNTDALLAIEQQDLQSSTRFATIDHALNEQNNRLSAIDLLNTHQNDRLTTIESKNLLQNNQITSMQTNGDESDKKVWFSANLNKKMEHHGPIMFNTVEESEGGGYNPNSGRFTAPANAGGVYEFSCEVYNGNLENNYQIRLVKSNTRGHHIWLREGISRGKKYQSFTISYITHLNPGDQAWCILSDGRLFGGSQTNWNYFSGKLIYADA